MRRFYLARDRDLTGVSGVGLVAHGVVFDDGACVIRWVSAHPSMVMWESLESAMAVHGHDGATRVEWVDQ